MEMPERVKILRTSLGLTQTEFGNKIGFRQNTVGQMENGQRGITDRTIILICQTFNVSEEWLRTGVGEMLMEDSNTLTAQLAEQFHLDAFSRRFIETYVSLPDAQKEAIKKFAYAVVAGESANMEIGEELSSAPEESHGLTEPEIDAEVESYRRELEQEKSTRTSSASRDSEKTG